MDCTLHYTMYNYEVKLVNYYCCSNVVNVSQGQYWRLHLRNACDCDIPESVNEASGPYQKRHLRCCYPSFTTVFVQKVLQLLQRR